MPRQAPLGFLYPGYAAEDDYPRIGAALEGAIDPVVVHTNVGEDAHRVDALLELGSTKNLLDGARVFRERHVEAAVWACTSGSFVFGWDGAIQQAKEIEEFLGVPASSTSIAFVNAAHALGLRRVAIAATYPEDVARHFVTYLRQADIAVVELDSAGVITAAEVGTFTHDDVLSLAESANHADAEAVLIPDTALHTIEWIPELERRLGKPVLTANQVTVWEAMRLAGCWTSVSTLGALFREGTPAA